MNKFWLRTALAVCTLAATVLAAAVGYLLPRWIAGTTSITPAEINDELDTPDRGFYYIHGFVISDDMDCDELVEKSFSSYNSTELTLLEINLRNYSDGEISESGLRNLQTLFDCLRARDKRLIVRFLYDWQGKAQETEPEDIAIILRHMEQIGPIVRRNRDIIFTLQGTFTGDVGEMHHTKHDDWKTLIETLAAAVGEDVYLAVRTPKQWRSIISEDAAESALAAQLGLFNDGMMGSGSDLGTYGDAARADANYSAAWRREDELKFQDELCRRVPNGGEVVYDTPYNDFANAVENMRTMHISYLNRDYDARALNKWADYRVTEQGVWNGMDGLTYIERHLGYRFVLRGGEITYLQRENRLYIKEKVANVGFAPAYRDVRAELVFVNNESGVCSVFPMSGNLRSLSGGLESDETLTLRAGVPVDELTYGDCTVCVRLYSEDWGQEIPLANAEQYGTNGYIIGTITARESIWKQKLEGMAWIGR